LGMGVKPKARVHRRRKGWAEQQSRLLYRLVVLLVGLFLEFWVRRYKAVGAERVPSEGGVFVIANHTSAMDPLLIGYSVAHRLMSGPGKVQLFQYRPVAFFLMKLGIFPIRQGVADAAAVRTMVALYRAGRAVIVYPEGGRSPGGDLMPFFPEFARLVIKLRAPLSPAAIAGAKDLLPVGSLIPKRDTAVAVVFGEPFELSDYYERPLSEEAVREATQVLEGRVRAVLGEARDERRRLAGEARP
jgi:1-acyl-sn-glycerol-3-phosphate acyltransferase